MDMGPRDTGAQGGAGGTAGTGGTGGTGGAGGTGVDTAPPTPDVPAAGLSIAPGTATFATTTIGMDSATMALTVTNTGTAAVTVTTALAGTNAGDFALATDGCNNKSLAANATCTIDVRFRPTVAGMRSAQVTVMGGGSSAMARLMGTGAEPALTLTISPTTHDFGSVAVGQMGTPREFTITNTGMVTSGALTVATGGGSSFSVGTNTCTTLAAAATCTFTVLFAPTTTGAKTGTVTVTAAAGAMVMATLAGNATPAPPSLVFDAMTKDAGSSPMGVRRDISFTVTNPGASATGVPMFSIAGTNASDFTVATNSCAAIPAMGGCSVTIAFTPSAVGARTATLTVAASPGGTSMATITGTGAGPALLTLQPALHDYGAVVSGGNQSVDFDFTVTNSGGNTSGALAVQVTSGNSDYTIVTAPANDCSGVTLTAMATCTLRVRFRPLNTGERTGALAVTASPGGMANAVVAGRTVNAGQLIAGLSYRYFESAAGTPWTALPDFNTLTASKAGTVANFDLSVRSRDDNFAIEYSGLVRIDSPGAYVFFTNSDDGSKLFIDGVQVVNNDGVHSATEALGTVQNLTVGYHDIKVVYFNGTGTRSLAVSYQGPGISKMPIPAGNLFRGPAPAGTLPAVAPGNVVAGLAYSYYQGAWSTLPNFGGLTADKTGFVPNFSIAPRNRDDNFGFDFTGFINVPATGDYNFYTTSNDGSRLYIDGTQVVDNDGIHAAQEATGTVKLEAGFHAIRVTYFEATGANESLEVRYDGPGIAKALIPDAALYRAAGPVMPAVSPGNVVAGVDYKYYEVTGLTVVPDFTTLPLVRLGNTASFGIPAGLRDNDFALDLNAFLDVPATGEYTFFTSSNDGSKLYIDGVQVVDNDGLHADQERSGTANLAAGYHAIRVTYFETGGTAESLAVRWQGPNVVKELIPNANLFRTVVSAVSPGAVLPGLYFKAFEGTYTALPNFDTQTPVAIGTATTVNLTPLSRPNNAGLDFTGYINVPMEGDYTFFTNSDDGSRLFIAGQEIVNNDGIHNAAVERSGTIRLAAGYHAFRTIYFRGAGAGVLDVRYQGPNIAKVSVPAGVLFRSTTSPAVNAGTVVAGLAYSYYEGTWTTLPNFGTLTAVKNGNVLNFDLSVRDRAADYGFEYTGYISIAAEADYTFFTSSNDGSRLFVDGQEVVSNDGLRSALVEQSGTIRLAAGHHRIRVVYFDNGGTGDLIVSYQRTGLAKEVVPAGVLFRN